MPAELPFRDPVAGFLSLGGLLLSLVGTALLLVRCGPDTGRLLVAAVFGLSMTACFLASTLHHLVRSTPDVERRLFRLDYAAIYVFIAGTYTPVCVHVLGTPGALALLGLVWAAALAGVVHAVWLAPDPPNVSDPPTVAGLLPYLALGWLAVAQLTEIMARSRGLTLLFVVVGGAAYTVGGVILTRRLFDLWPGRFGHHEAWHLCVLLGAGCLYGYVYFNLV